jgi:tetratricopeptide (TPR) repeat protein
MLRSAAIDPYRYYSLGEFFQERNQDEKAATYFEKAMALHPDSVAAAGRSSWLIKYYQRKGMISKALALADKAAEVYSYSGLQAKADLLESLGKYDEAWEYFLKLEERYERSDDLMAFIARYKAKTGNTRYDHELQTRLGKLFPKGLEKATIQTLGSPPSDGAIIKQDGKLISDAGLRVGDIIVAVHAIRVHNMQQYSFARETRKAPGMELIVWQQNHYVEIKCSPPGHRFNVDFATYAGK